MATTNFDNVVTLAPGEEFINTGPGNDIVIFNYADNDLLEEAMYLGGEGQEDVIDESVLADAIDGEAEFIEGDGTGDVFVIHFESQAVLNEYFASIGVEDAQGFQDYIATHFDLDGNKWNDLSTIGINAQIKQFENIVLSVTAPPVDAVDAVDDVFSVQEGQSGFFNLLENDTSGAGLPGEGLIVVAINGISIDSIDYLDLEDMDLNLTGVVSFSPDGLVDVGVLDRSALTDGEFIDFSFTYTVADENNNTDDATVTIRVEGVNDGPDITNTFLAISEDDMVAAGGVVGQFSAFDPEGDVLTYSGGTSSVLVDQDGTAKLADFDNTNVFLDTPFTVSDGNSSSAGRGSVVVFQAEDLEFSDIDDDQILQTDLLALNAPSSGAVAVVSLALVDEQGNVLEVLDLNTDNILADGLTLSLGEDGSMLASHTDVTVGESVDYFFRYELLNNLGITDTASMKIGIIEVNTNLAPVANFSPDEPIDLTINLENISRYSLEDLFTDSNGDALTFELLDNPDTILDDNFFISTEDGQLIMPADTIPVGTLVPVIVAASDGEYTTTAEFLFSFGTGEPI